MNFDVKHIPERTTKNRDNGLTMMMDKGLSLREAENFVDSSNDFTDLVKFGFGTALVTKNLSEKIRVYREGGIEPYFGGTLFEMFAVRENIDDFKRLVDKYGIETVEVLPGWRGGWREHAQESGGTLCVARRAILPHRRPQFG